MPQQIISSVENNFTKGLITEATGLNFPENAATDTDNCIYTLVGDVIRRQGINLETNGATSPISTGFGAIVEYKWNNVGGDGLTQLIAVQVGNSVYFWLSSQATVNSPLSTQFMNTNVNLNQFVATGLNSAVDTSIECQFADGNGYLFIFHPNCDPIYCSYDSSTKTVTAKGISLQIRDFIGVPETGIADNLRPSTLTQEHQYNLSNQGWTVGNPYVATSTTTATLQTGSVTFTTQSGLAITVGDAVACQSSITQTFFNGSYYQTYGAGGTLMSGNVTGYSGTNLTINITSVGQGALPGQGGVWSNWQIVPNNIGFVNTWHTALGNYPSNADVWWYFKNSSNVFDPATTAGSVTLGAGRAPGGHYLLNPFLQNRSGISSATGIANLVTTVRPRTGAWFQGRVWYAGVDASQLATGDMPYYTWTETIYFSQVVTDATDFGKCYQNNDPTSENLFDLLPTDGGTIVIPGSGSIYKLFPIANGLLVFAANGVWFITGSQGIGFSANDYTQVPLSAIRSISGSSFVNVNGLPYFWNEEGIYSVSPSQQGQLTVEPITVGTILSFYNNIPTNSKKFARGAYDPINYIITWVFSSTDPGTNLFNRYTYDRVLNFNTYNKAFYPYTVNTTAGSIVGVIYVSNPVGNNTVEPALKYLARFGSPLSLSLSFAEENDSRYIDWGSVNFDSFFVTGYKLHGKGQFRFQIPYIYMYSRNENPTAYKIQGLWDYALTGNSGKWSVAQLVNNWSPNFGVIPRRHKIRGHGLLLQLKVTSVDGKPFDIIGWSVFENVNAGV